MTNEDWGNIVDDQTAYEKLYVDSFKKFYNYGKKFTPDSFIIEDSIQEVFLYLWTNKHKLKEVKSVNSYFFSSFRYILLRKIKNEKRIVSNAQFDTEPSFSIELELSDGKLNNELQLRLKKALAALTPHQREAIFLRFYQNLSYEEVADVLKISVKSTYKIMARSLSALKECIADIILLLFLLSSG